MPMVLWHWANLLAIGFLALSGFYIHYPIIPGLMGLARGTHFFWMFVLLIALVCRLIFLFTVKDANMPDTREVAPDYKNWLPQAANRHQMWPWVKYYLFLKKEHPISAKYGVLQKIAYWVVPFLILAAAYTGFCLWGPTMNLPFFRQGTIWVASLFNIGGGGDPMAMRIVHYWIMWIFLIFTAAHVYLANIYNFAPSKMIFAWKETVHSSERVYED